MEQIIENTVLNSGISEIPEGANANPGTAFIVANTKEVSLKHLKEDCTIPVFSKDNECTISHQEFIESIWETVNALFQGHTVLDPEIRVSHVVKGRIPSAVGKPVRELQEHEKTIYYERMMFLIEVPSITINVGGNPLNLAIGGVRAYNLENLNSKKSMERFKIFMGFQNMVCLNMCVSTDGYVGDLRVGSTHELKERYLDLAHAYEIQKHLEGMQRLQEYSISQSQFAHLIGRLRLYNHDPEKEKHNCPSLSLTDGQLGPVVKSMYAGPHAASREEGNISLWELYNWLTAANKSSYIDTFLSRSSNAYDFVQELAISLEDEKPFWYLH